MTLLVIFLIWSILINIFLFWQCVKYNFFKEESDDESESISFERHRHEVREAACDCKKNLYIVLKDRKKSQL